MPTMSSVFRRSVALLAMVVSASLLLPFCSSLNVFPVSDDQKLGAQFDAEIRASPAEYPLLNNASARAYVQGIVDKLVRAPDIKYRGTFAYRTEIIKDDKTINAFCTPGGYIYVYTGLIRVLDNEAALAGVLGHEIAHAELRHSTSRMTKALGLQALTDIVLGNNPDNRIKFAANAFTGLGLLKNSRDDEMASDDYSFRYLRSTSWYPGAINYFFDKVKGRSGSDIERLLSTHPLPQDRIEATNARLRKNNIPPPTEAQLNSRGYADFKKNL